MDLALEFGVPVKALKRSMSERELRLWARYANEQRLPSRRIEYYLAQIAFLIARTAGGSKSESFTDFMIDFAPQTRPSVEAMIGADVMAAAAGTNVRVLGQRRRQREQREHREQGIG